MLIDESGFVLTLNNFEKATEVEYPGAFHIGFMQESRERVDEMHRRLKADGFDVKTPKEFHGAWTFYFRARAASSSRSCTNPGPNTSSNSGKGHPFLGTPLSGTREKWMALSPRKRGWPLSSLNFHPRDQPS